MTDTHQHDKAHSHGATSDANTRLLSIALALIVGFLLVEVIVAIISGSLALLSDAGHMLTDTAALAGSLVVIRLAARPSSSKWTFGLKRAEILSAAVNGITLVVISGIVAVEAIRRLLDPPKVEGGPVLVVALLGVAVNLVAVWVLAKANRQSLNVEGSFQHILTDLYAFIATVLAGVLILFAGFTRADTIASLIIVVLMLHAAWGLLTDSGRILLEGTPEDVDLDAIRGHLLEPAHVLAVHDLHAWTVTSDLPALSAHVTLTDECFQDGHAPRVLDELQACLVGHFNLEHSTFQLEPARHNAHEPATDHP